MEFPLKSLPETKQELFDAVCEHLMKQQACCFETDEDGEARCLYRGEDGLMCAFGAVLPDDLYEPGFESDSASFVLEKIENRHGISRDEEFRELADLLQLIHDGATRSGCSKGEDLAEHFKHRLSSIAGRCRLQKPDCIAD